MAFRTRNILNELSRECLDIEVGRRFNSGNVIDGLTDLFTPRDPPDFINSDNDPKFAAQTIREWIKAIGEKIAYTTPGYRFKNGNSQSFNDRMRDEILDGEICYILQEVRITIANWKNNYKTKRPCSALGY